MKNACLPLLALLLTAFTCGADPTAASLGQCPNGHTTLVDVAIPHDRHGIPELMRIGNGTNRLIRYIWGSYGTNELNAPTNTVICTTCLFQHVLYHRDAIAAGDILIDATNFGGWSRTVTNTEGFTAKFPVEITTFPVPPPEKTGMAPYYTQALDDRRQPQSAEISYRSLQPRNEIKGMVNEWLKQNHLEAVCVEELDTYPLLGGQKYSGFKWTVTKPEMIVPEMIVSVRNYNQDAETEVNVSYNWPPVFPPGFPVPDEWK